MHALLGLGAPKTAGAIGLIRVAVVVGALVVGVAACGGQPAGNGEVRVEVQGGGTYVDVSPERLATLLEAKDFTLVNVHIPYEGEIAKTDLFIAYDQIGSRLAELPEPEAMIVLYCRSGSMSTTAATTLVRAGYTNVWNLAGGMNAWRAAGFGLQGTAAT